MFSCSRILSCAGALFLTGSVWAQMQPPPGGQTPPAGSPMGAPQSTAPGTPDAMSQSPQMDPYSTDKDFVKNAAESSVAGMQLGKLAQEKASSDAVKNLGKQMAEANTQTTKQLKQAATALKIQVSSEPPHKTKKAEEKLAKLSGADFDRAFAKVAADQQKQAVKHFQDEAKNGKVQGVKEFAAKNLPAEQQRQKQAEDLASAGAPASK